MKKLLASLFLTALPLQAQLELKQGDSIAILSSGVADRSQHYGWL